MLPRALSLGFAQLTDRAILWVLAKSLLITFILTALIGLGIGWAGKAWVEGRQWGADAGVIAGIALVLGVVAGAWLLFRAIAIPVITFFSDEIVVAVEARHYPDRLASARPMSLWAGVRLGLVSVGRLVLFNLLALPLYLVLLFTAVGPIILFVGINAVLLGRDLADMVGPRHADAATMRAWLAESRTNRFLIGLIVTGLFTIPFANLIAPVLGAAAMTHLFHQKARP